MQEKLFIPNKIKEYCEINNIPWENSYYAFDLDVNKQYEYR